MKENTSIFEEYFDSLFIRSNRFAKKDYNEIAIVYETNYGKFLPFDKNAKILDVGCGAGHFLHSLKNKGYKNLYGIDMSTQQIDFCKKNNLEQVEVADALAFLKKKEDYYDVIVANNLLEHIPKDKMFEFLALVYKALNADSIFLTMTPNLGNPFAISSRYRDFTHTVGFTDKSLFQVLWLAGFRDIQILPLQQKKVIRRILTGLIHISLRKLYWWQGFVAPDILTSSLIGVAKKINIR